MPHVNRIMWHTALATTVHGIMSLSSDCQFGMAVAIELDDTCGGKAHLLLPLLSLQYSTRPPTPPLATTSCASSGVCFTTSLTNVAACFLTNSSGYLRQVKHFGNTSASTTISARSTECLATWLRALQTWGSGVAQTHMLWGTHTREDTHFLSH